MKLIAYVDREGGSHGWPPAGPAAGIRLEMDVDPEAPFDEIAREVVLAAGFDPAQFYYWPHFLLSASGEDLVNFPSAVVAADGQILWSEGARNLITFADLQRTRDTGLFEGDPYAIYLEQPMYGDSMIPNWLNLFEWLAAIGGSAQLLSWLKAHYTKWEVRGARTPFAFLDLVLTRQEWVWKDLAQLLDLSEDETLDLLEIFGYEPVDVIRSRWRVSDDPKRLALRRQLLRDQLHRDDEDTEDNGAAEE
jgi:hypothetical protein